MCFILHNLRKKKAFSRSNYNLIEFHHNYAGMCFDYFLSDASFHCGVGEFFSKVYKTRSETCLALLCNHNSENFTQWLLRGEFLVSLHGQKPCSGGISTRSRRALSVASDFSSLYASLSVYTSCWKLCGQCWLFAESQSSSKATDKATAGGWVAGWRREGDSGGGFRGLNASLHHGPRPWRKGWLIGA